MIFVRTTDGAIFSEDRLRSEFPNVSFPVVFKAEDVQHLGMEELVFTEKPSENCYYTAEKQSDGRWFTVWHVVEEQPQLDEVINAIKITVQRRLDDYAKSMGYDNILSACTYATSSVERFRLEGQRCVELRDKTWEACFDLQDKVNRGEVVPPKDNLIVWVFEHLPSFQ